MSIRPAAQADAAGLSRIHVASFDDGWSENDFVTWLGRNEAIAFVAEGEREPVAFGLALEAGDAAELLTIATNPDRRRGGWGKQIFHALDAEASKRGLQRWVLEVASKNLPAIGLYKSVGFVEIGIRKAYYRTPDGRDDAFVMSRKVGLTGGQDGG